MCIGIMCRVLSRLTAAIDPSAERFALQRTKIVLELCFLGHRPSRGPDAAVSRRDGGTNLAVSSSFKLGSDIALESRSRRAA